MAYDPFWWQQVYGSGGLSPAQGTDDPTLNYQHTSGPGPLGGTIDMYGNWTAKPGFWDPRAEEERSYNTAAGRARSNRRDALNFFNQLMGRGSKWMDRFGQGMSKWGKGSVPEAWAGEPVGGVSSVDPSAVIAGARPRIMEEMNRAMGGAAQRLGALGVPLTGSAYTTKLGDAARKATADITETTEKYLYDSAQQQAAREQEARQNAINRSLQAWQTHGDWQANANRDWQSQWSSQWPQLMSMFQGMLGDTSGFFPT